MPKKGGTDWVRDLRNILAASGDSSFRLFFSLQGMMFFSKMAFRLVGYKVIFLKFKFASAFRRPLSWKDAATWPPWGGVMFLQNPVWDFCWGHLGLDLGWPRSLVNRRIPFSILSWWCWCCGSAILHPVCLKLERGLCRHVWACLGMLDMLDMLGMLGMLG